MEFMGEKRRKKENGNFSNHKHEKRKSKKETLINALNSPFIAQG